MANLSTRAQNTIKAIVREFGENDIAYAIARNYESYPDFGHDLDLYYLASSKSFKKIAVVVSAEYDWDVVTYCNHWSKSPIPEHNIDVFRFYKLTTNEYLQVDLFRGFLVWGLPLVNAKEILKHRDLHDSGLFYRPNLAIENIFRLLQINSLVTNKNAIKKIARYRERVFEYVNMEMESLLKYSQILGLSYIEDSLRSLSENNFSQFSYYINKSKKRFLIQSLLKHPIISFRQLFARMLDYYRLFLSSPCGLEIEVYTQNSKQKKMVAVALDELVRSSFISSWTDVNNNLFLSLKERRVLERAGIVIRWVNQRGKNTICVDDSVSSHDVYMGLQDRIIFCHEVIYKKS